MVGRQVALTGCSRSSETRAQWTDVSQGVGRPQINVPARIKTLTSCMRTIWFWVKRTSPNSQHCLWNVTRQAFLSHLFHSVVRIKGSAAECFTGATCARADWGAVHCS